MKQVRFVFFKAKFEWRNVLPGRKIRLIDDGISLWTGLFNWFTPGYSHVEVWIHEDPDWDYWVTLGDSIYGKSQHQFRGICYTSTMRGDDNGTVSRPASTVFKYPKRWEYIEFEVTDESFEHALVWADERVFHNKGYSKRDLLRFAMPLWLLKGLKIADPDREICSEHGEGWAIRLWSAAFSVGWFQPLLNYIFIRSPRRLWRDLVRRHHVPTYSLTTGLMVRDEKGKKVK
ncbi:MAG TPA: hypothetical protein ENH62_10870 [Marinobacter sp.]|uniref:Uncharacterized protein n=1 Tax=marine sediment metagenome TaxID=412755 RepID=A0A0F9KRE8_9ZZZZ|nr:hypothetical protein [Marinobacter sp.]